MATKVSLIYVWYIYVYIQYMVYMCSSASRACVAVSRVGCSIVYRIYRREQCKRRSLKTTTLQHSPPAPPPQPPRPERSLYVKPIYKHYSSGGGRWGPGGAPHLREGVCVSYYFPMFCLKFFFWEFGGLSPPTIFIRFC